MGEDKSKKNQDDELLELLKRAINIASMGIHVIDLETYQLYYSNDAGFRLINEEPADYHGRTCYETFFGLEHPCQNCRLQEAKMGETRHETYVPEAGRFFLTNTEINKWNGKDVLVEYITDITQHKRAEEKQSQLYKKLEVTSREFQRKFELERQRSLDDQSLMAYALFNLHTGETLEVKRREPLSLIEQPIKMEDFCRDIEETILEPEAKKAFLYMFNRQELLEKNKEGFQEEKLEYQRVLPNGKVIWVRSIFKLITEPSGTDVLLLYYCNDINMQKSLEIMTSFLTNEDYDMIGCINFHDDSAIMLYGKNSTYQEEGNLELRKEENYSEALEWFANNAVVPEEREQYKSKLFIGRIKSELSMNPSYEFMVHTMAKDATIKTKRIKYIRYDSKAEICFFTQTDITQMLAEEEERQKNLENALRDAKRANQSKSEFYSRMSHDMRTPMNGILGLAELSSDETDITVLKNNLKKIQSSGEYLLGLINDTLDIQRIESGKLQLEPKVVNIRDLKNDIVEMLQSSLNKKHLHFNIISKNTTMDGYMRIDPVRVKQIFINLISNSIKFTPEGGSITVVWECLKRENNYSYDQFKVIDTGIGMSKDFIENKIFHPFSQEYNEISEKYVGSGLGLSIVKSLIELMGGTIQVESELGKGTTFTLFVCFELVEEEKAFVYRDEREKKVEGVKESLEGVKVLMAEDHPLNAEIMIRLLEKAGCETKWVKDGQECVNVFRDSKMKQYDIILMDISMPVLDGIQATREIRGLSRKDAASIPIIAMTANAYAEDVRRCLEAGMNEHISKPINPALLYSTIAKQL